MGGVSSFNMNKDFSSSFVVTFESNIYWVDNSSLNSELRTTSHYEKINDICFPNNFYKVFATCSKNEIRIWRMDTKKEILRI